MNTRLVILAAASSLLLSAPVFAQTNTVTTPDTTTAGTPATGAGTTHTHHTHTHKHHHKHSQKNVNGTSGGNSYNENGGKVTTK